MKKYQVRVNGIPFEVELDLVQDDEAELPAGLPQAVASVPRSAPPPPAVAPVPRPVSPMMAAQPGQVLSPLTGALHKVLVQPGASVKRGDVLVEIEAMKMNTKVYAPSDGVVGTVHVKEGDGVQQGQLLVTLKGN
ncbi:MAG: biotin/lipoyl-binding protein [bacterium]|nr:biotin/lipoyl-binding protein [bacterium]